MSEFPVVAIRSVDIGVADMARAEAFYTETWGLAVAAREGDAVYLHATGRDHHVLALHAHHCSEILGVSFRVATEDTLAQIAAAVTSADGIVLEAARENLEPDGGLVLKVLSPEGYILRFHHGDLLRAEEDSRCGFPFRISHVNLNCKDVDASSDFFRSVLG